MSTRSRSASSFSNSKDENMRFLTDLEVKRVDAAKKLLTGCKSSATKASRASMAAGTVWRKTLDRWVQ
jgi:hypothetical protein